MFEGGILGHDPLPILHSKLLHHEARVEGRHRGASEHARPNVDRYLASTDYVQAGLARAQKAGKDRDVKRYEKAKGNIETVFVAIVDCADMVPVLNVAVAADPDNMDLKLGPAVAQQKERTDNDLFLPVATAVYSVEPSAPAAYAIGIGFAKASQPTRA